MKWVSYMKFMFDSPLYLITGSQEEIAIRSAHNVYVQMLFNVGLIPVVFFSKKIISLFKLSLKHNKESIYFIIPFHNPDYGHCFVFILYTVKTVPTSAKLANYLLTNS